MINETGGNETILTVHNYSSMLMEVAKIFITKLEFPKCIVTHLLEHSYPSYRKQAKFFYPIQQGVSHAPRVQLWEFPKAVLQLTLAENTVKRIQSIVHTQTTLALQSTTSEALASYLAKGTLKKYKTPGGGGSSREDRPPVKL